MSDFNKIQRFSDEAKELERQLFDEEGNLRSEPLTTSEPEPDPEPAEPEATQEVEVAPLPHEPTAEEKKYKDAVKAMNEAQRESAELKKAQKAQEEKQKELEARLTEILEDKKREAAKVFEEPEDDLEADPGRARPRDRRGKQGRHLRHARHDAAGQGFCHWLCQQTRSLCRALFRFPSLLSSSTHSNLSPI